MPMQRTKALWGFVFSNRAPKAPRTEPILYLNGARSGLVNNACFPSTVAPSYAPAGQVRRPARARVGCCQASCLVPCCSVRVSLMPRLSVF